MADEAKRRLNNIGYVHPDNNTTESHRDPVYRSYTENKGYEKYGISTTNRYGIFNQEETDSKHYVYFVHEDIKNVGKTCPVCKTKIVMIYNDNFELSYKLYECVNKHKLRIINDEVVLDDV